MGKTFKEKPGKYKNNRDFQKKQGKKQKGNKSYSPFEDSPEFHDKFAN